MRVLIAGWFVAMQPRLAITQAPHHRGAQHDDPARQKRKNQRQQRVINQIGSGKFGHG